MGDKNGKVAHQAHPLGATIAMQLAPLAMKEKLTELMVVDLIGQGSADPIQGGRLTMLQLRGPRRPLLLAQMIPDGAEARIVGQPGGALALEIPKGPPLEQRASRGPGEGGVQGTVVHARRAGVGHRTILARLARRQLGGVQQTVAHQQIQRNEARLGGKGGDGHIGGVAPPHRIDRQHLPPALSHGHQLIDKEIGRRAQIAAGPRPRQGG